MAFWSLCELEKISFKSIYAKYVVQVCKYKSKKREKEIDSQQEWYHAHIPLTKKKGKIEKRMKKMIIMRIKLQTYNVAATAAATNTIVYTVFMISI